VATLYGWAGISCNLGGEQIQAGSLQTAFSATVTECFHRIYSIPNDGVHQDIFIAGVDLLDFQMIWIAYEWVAGAGVGVCDLQIVIDNNNGVGREEIAIGIEALKPFQLWDNLGYANYTLDFAAATADAIERFSFRNPVASTKAALVRTIAFR
jgi:hypothetical protein